MKITAALLACVSVAQAAAQSSLSDDLVLMLACAPFAMRPANQDEAKRQLEPLLAKKEDGSEWVAGRVQAANGACIEKVEVMAAFGVLFSVGRLCQPDPAPLLDLIKQAGVQLQPQPVPPVPKAIAGYGADGRYTIAFVKGPATLEQRRSSTNDDNDATTSFICSYKGSGPQ